MPRLSTRFAPATRWFLLSFCLALSLALAACGKPASNDKKDSAGQTEAKADDKDKKSEDAAAKTDAEAEEGEDEDEEDEEGDSSVTVETALAARKSISASYTGTAALEAEREADVVAKTSGVLMKLHVEEGDMVKAGQVLAELDSERPRLEVERASATLRRLENDYKRSQELFAKKLASSEAHDRTRYDLDTQRAAYDLAKLELSYTRILAPIDGVISERKVKAGNLIQLHQALFSIDDFDPLMAVLNVPERELNTLKVGQPVAMQVDSHLGQNFAGAVARISPVVDPGTGTFRVTAEFHDESARLKSGMFGRLSIIYDQRDNVLVIPRESLMEEDGETAVYVVEQETPEEAKAAKEEAAKDNGNKAEQEESNGKSKPAKPRMLAHRRIVKTGYTSGGEVEVLDGLAEGAAVITVGRAAVREGTSVHVLEAAP